MSAPQLSFVENAEDAAEMMRWLGTEHHGPLSLDVETGGPDTLRWHVPGARVKLFQVGDAARGWAVDFRRWRGLCEDVVTAWNRERGGWCNHNLAFDMLWLAMEGIELEGDLFCSMVCSQFLDPAGPHGLKPLGDLHVERGMSSGQLALNEAMSRNKWTWDTVPVDFPLYWAYGALDTVIARRLRDHYVEQQASRLACESWEIEQAVLPILVGMQRRGLAVDQEYVTRKERELEGYVVELRSWSKEVYGVGNLTAGQQVARALIADGVELTERTGSGLWKTNGAIMLDTGHPLAHVFVDAKRAVKIARTYLSHLHVETVYPQIKQSAAHTGRMSAADPAVHQLPRGTVVRDAIVARAGKRLVSCDFDQVEMRVLAHLCQDPFFIEAIHSGDLHTLTARQVYRDDTIQKADPRRQISKVTGFATVYGAQAAQIARTAGVPLSEAQEFYTAHQGLYPGIYRYMAETTLIAKREGFIVSPFGRRQVVKDRNYALTNYAIQGTAGEVFKRQLVRLAAAGFGDSLLLPVHDEIIAEVDDDSADEAAAEIANVMTFRGWPEMPLTAAAGHYQRWGDKYRSKDGMTYQQQIDFELLLEDVETAEDA